MNSRISLLKPMHIQLLAALEGNAHLGNAARDVGISQPAASRMLTEIETLIGTAVHIKKGRGIELSAAGKALALRARRIRRELDNAAKELAEIETGGVGHVRIGAVTSAAIEYILPAIQKLKSAHPKLSIDVTVGPSREICAGVRRGELDFGIGRLVTDGDRRELTFEPLQTEPVAFIVRADHPLTQNENLASLDLFVYDWVLPEAGSPISRAVLGYFEALGSAMPAQRVSTSSLLLTVGMVRRSYAIAPIARSAFDILVGGLDGSDLAVLPINGVDVGVYGLITLRDHRLTGSAALFSGLF